jgi:hypothetical protein
MATYVMVFKGGGMPQTEEERQTELARWGEWYGALGPAVVDGGKPFGQSAALASDGTSSQGAPSGLTGYAIVNADSLNAATDMGKGCPILRSGGSIEVYETFDVM